MNLEVYKNVGTRVLGRGLLLVQKHSPEILTAAGIIGTVTASVLAARATLKLEATVDLAQDRINDAREFGTQSDLVKAQVQAVADVGKLYAVPVFLGAASIGAIVGGHGILQKRNVALVAAYKTLETGYAKYRQRVVEELGSEKDEDFRLGLKDEKIKDESGKTKTIKVSTGDPNERSVYARFFDEFNVNWRPSAENNLYFLKAQQNYFNQILQSRGHVFLNEVYDSLGIERSQAGQVVGWVLSKEGDNFIDFGIYNASNPMVRHFVNGNEAAIILDFNVDGVVYDKI